MDRGIDFLVKIKRMVGLKGGSVGLEMEIGRCLLDLVRLSLSRLK
jgi:hypothetical protein